MPSSVLTFAACAGSFCVLALLCAASLWLALRMLHASSIGWQRIVGTALAISSALTLLIVLYWLSPTLDGKASLLVGLVTLLIAWGVTVTGVKLLLPLSWHTTAKAGSLTLLILVCFTGSLISIVGRTMTESFVISANSMAPTLLGRHMVGVCPECGESCYSSVDDWRFRRDEKLPTEMICQNFHALENRDYDPQPLQGDRILVNKLLTPQRWDAVAFHFVGDPSMIYIKRLVGLPGEKLHIADGAVWINDKQLTPPESIRGIQYSDRIEGFHEVFWGSADRPVTLGEDEYFMLGDYSDASRDSRLWQEGAPGYPPYAVPKSHLIGIATHIYWPVDRVRKLRAE